MAIANRSVNQGNRSVTQGSEMSFEEFKKWLKRFDADGDNRISMEELRTAIRAGGVWWLSSRKARRGIRMADINGNGAIDDFEIKNLVDFAQKYLGIKVTTI